MAHEIHASIVVRLEDDKPAEWTSALSVVAAQWAAFLTAVEPLPRTVSFVVTEGMPSAANGTRRSHRRKTPAVVVEEPAALGELPG
jgi:hypothetical protein